VLVGLIDDILLEFIDI